MRREKFWNLPNTITMMRTGAVPVMLLLPWFGGNIDHHRGSEVIAWIFTVAALSDLVDGWLARREGIVTNIGKLLDPLADKLLVSTGLIVLVAMDRIPDWAIWMVVVIVGRELAVTGLRGIASANGQIMAASGLGKIKTVSQNFAVGALIFYFPTYYLPMASIGLFCLVLSTLLTLLSGYTYFASYFGAQEPVDS